MSEKSGTEAYEAPAITPLGSVSELTQAPVDVLSV